MRHEQWLCGIFQRWTDRQGLPAYDAEELLMSADLTIYQRRWLSRFVRLWMICENPANKEFYHG